MFCDRISIILRDRIWIFKDHLEESGTRYSIFDISKTKIRHLCSLRVLLENYVRNNGNAFKRCS